MDPLFQTYTGAGLGRNQVIGAGAISYLIILVVIVIVLIIPLDNPKVSGIPWWIITLFGGLNLMEISWLVWLQTQTKA